MLISRVQAIIGITLVAGFVLTAVVIALTPAVGGYPVAEYTEHLKTFSSTFSGLVGIVVGYFFGKGRSAPETT